MSEMINILFTEIEITVLIPVKWDFGLSPTVSSYDYRVGSLSVIRMELLIVSLIRLLR